VLANGAIVTGCGLAAQGMEKERADTPVPKSVSHAGVRYEALAWGRARGLAQNGGYVLAIDEQTGIERWIVKIYDARIDDGKEQDKSDVFITSLAFDAHKRYLLIVNERGDAFRLDLRTRAVEVLK
jgi:hypothetical protein